MPQNEEESPNWQYAKRLRLLSEGFYSGHPYHEGFPRYPWSLDGGRPLFEIVTAWGLRAEAFIDSSREFRSEGLEWVIRIGRRTRHLPQDQVAGWRRIPGRSRPHPTRH